MRRFAFYADTPYQLLNCINFVWHDVEGAKGKGDLYLLNDDEKYPYAVRSLQRSNLFRNIYIVTKQKETNRMIRYIRRTRELLFPEALLKSCCPNGVIQKNYYDVVAFSTICPMTISIADLNRNAKVWMYDDGLGCYIGDWVAYFDSMKAHLFYKLSGKGPASIDPERLYVNNVEFCRTTMNVQLMQMPSLKEEEYMLRLLQDVFRNDSPIADMDEKYIFLSQPFDETIPSSAMEKLHTILGNR